LRHNQNLPFPSNPLELTTDPSPPAFSTIVLNGDSYSSGKQFAPPVSSIGIFSLLFWKRNGFLLLPPANTTTTNNTSSTAARVA